MTKDEFTDLVGIEYADEYEKAQLSQEGTTKGTTFSYSHENDTISRRAAVELVMEYCPDDDGAVQCDGDIRELLDELENLPSAQPENQVHLCDSCRHVYPECPSEKEDVIFGNGKGNDNICACNKYEPSAQPEQRWIPCSKQLPRQGQEVICQCRANIIKVLKLDAYGDWYQDADHCYMGGFVIAWMPLPEPYKEGEMT